MIKYIMPSFKAFLYAFMLAGTLLVTATTDHSRFVKLRTYLCDGILPGLQSEQLEEKQLITIDMQNTDSSHSQLVIHHDQ